MIIINFVISLFSSLRFWFKKQVYWALLHNNNHIHVCHVCHHKLLQFWSRCFRISWNVESMFIGQSSQLFIFTQLASYNTLVCGCRFWTCYIYHWTCSYIIITIVIYNIYVALYLWNNSQCCSTEETFVRIFWRWGSLPLKNHSPLLIVSHLQRFKPLLTSNTIVCSYI